MTIEYKGNLSFKGISLEKKERFDKLVENENLTRHEMLERLVIQYELTALDLDEQEISLLRQAKHIAPITYSRNIKKRALKVAESIIKSSQNNNDADINNKNSRLSADRRADILLYEIIKANDEAENWYNKTFISNSSLKKIAESKRESEEVKTALSKATIDRCLERNRAMIEAHHIKHQLNEKHNLLAFHERSKIEKEATKH